MRLALRLARRGLGRTSPNPMVGALLVRRGEILGRGWHRRAGEPHAEIEALRDAERRGLLRPGDCDDQCDDRQAAEHGEDQAAIARAGPDAGLFGSAALWSRRNHEVTHAPITGIGTRV